MADVKKKRPASGQSSKKKRTGSNTSRTGNTTGQRRTSSTKRSSSGRRTSGSKAKTKNADVSYHNEILVLVLFALSVLLLLSNFDLCGQVGMVLTNLTFGLFGVLGYIVPFVLFGTTCYYVLMRKQKAPTKRIICLAVLFALTCGLCQMFSMSGSDEIDLSWKTIHAVSMEGRAGGIVGGFFVKIFYPLFGKIATYVLLIALIMIFVVLFTGVSLTEAVKDRSVDVEKRNQLREVKAHEREAMRQIRREKRQMDAELLVEQRKLDSEKRIERARKEQEARRRLSGKQTEVTFDTKTNQGEFSFQGVIPGSSLEQSQKDRIKNPVVDPEEKSSFLSRLKNSSKDVKPAERPLSPVVDTETKKPNNSGINQSFTITYDNQTKSVSFDSEEQKSNVSTQPTSSKEEISVKKPTVLPTEPAKKDNWNSKIIDITLSSGYEDHFEEEDTDAPAYDDSKVVASSDKAAMIERMKRSGVNADGTKTIVTSSGRVITMEMDMGSEKHVAPMKREDGETTIFEDVSKAMQPIRPNAAPKKEYIFPPMDLLTKGQNSGRNMDDELRETAQKLQQTLQNFGVRVTVTNVSCGPAVTRYELQPEQGVKVSSIVRLQDDIKLNMAAADIRIEAPIPGKAAIGIEIPNKESAAVMLRDLLEAPEFVNHPSRLSFGAGKDIGGQTIVADVAKMPHLLIAGATGSGKSVCINTIIMSILYKAKPSEVKLIMIDPKVVELSVYNGIPHLMIPVVTDPKKAAGALSWAVAEMTSRYKKFAELSVRDLKGYNEKQQEQYDGPEEYRPAPLPQIVIIVDELADLMMVAPGEVEDSICRLAQMARAAGLHLILATQRPSVNVITGVIKANVPSRIAFSVSSGVDSRTILDMVGAEKLLGKGDMLYYPAGMQKPIRVQGAFVSDKEVSNVVSFITKQENVIGGDMDIASSIEQHMESSQGGQENASGAADTQDNDRNALDPLFKEAGLLIVGKDKASIGMLQRAFRIGFNRAARIMEQLADAELVGEEEGTKPRRVLMDESAFLAYCDENNIS